MPVVTRVTATREDLEGSEFATVHFTRPDVASADFWNQLQQLRHARTAWKIAKQLGELVHERVPLP